MIYKYEIACREAGLSEEKIAEIRRFFDAEKKKLKRENDVIEKTKFQYFSMNEAIDEERGITIYDVGDMNADTEMDAIKLWELEKLREYMSELSYEDQEFLYACFEDSRGAETRIAKKLGIPRQTVQYKKKKLIDHLRKKFMGAN